MQEKASASELSNIAFPQQHVGGGRGSASPGHPLEGGIHMRRKPNSMEPGPSTVLHRCRGQQQGRGEGTQSWSQL